ncbi:MAG: hypothetical protein AAGB51_08320 [Planctomycetota bacterium]
MKLKGINPIERNAEIIVFGLGVVLLVGVIAFQMVTVNEVEVGGQSYPVDRAFEPVEQRAERLRGSLLDGAPPIPEYTAPTIGQQVDALLADAGTPPAGRSIVLGGPMGLSGSLGDEPVRSSGTDRTGLRIADLSPPAPTAPLTGAYHTTIDPTMQVQYPDLREYLPVEQPFDVAGISFESTFAGTEFRELLQVDPDGPTGELSAVPQDWWFGAMPLLAVQAERRERVPGGEWSDPAPVELLPGQVDLLGRFQNGDLPDEASLFAAAEEFRAEIARAPFYPTIAGPGWQSPSEVARLARLESNRVSVDRLLGRIADLEEQITAVEEQLGRGGGGDGGGQGRDDDRRGGRDRDDDQDDAAEDANTARLEARIDDLRVQIVRAENELEELGWVAEGGQPQDAGGRELARSLLDEEAVRIWAHDLRVEPGREYSYRLRVVVKNPLRGQGRALSDQDRSRAAAADLEGLWSPWSEPVEAPSNEYVFLTAARESDPLGTAQPGATAEIYRYYYGFWRHETQDVQPGDEIATVIPLPSPDSLPIFRSSTPDSGGAGGGDGGGQGGGRDGRGGGRNNDRGPSVDVEFTAEPGREDLPVATGTILLDVTTTGGDGSPRIVFIRDAQGRIMIRRPEEEQVSTLRRWLDRSADAAADQETPTIATRRR